MNEPASTIVMLSGGPDSATLAARAVAVSRTAVAFHVSFGQATWRQEKLAAEQAGEQLGIRLEVADLNDTFRLFEGTPRYPDRMALAAVSAWCGGPLVPGLVGVGLCLALSYAAAVDAEAVQVAIHKDDLTPHPELAEAELAKLSDAMQTPLGRYVAINTPFSNMTKAEVLAEAAELNVPLSDTWSCLREGDIHCGECEACVRRHDAFRAAQIRDDTRYGTT